MSSQPNLGKSFWAGFFRVVEFAIKDWPSTLRLLCVMLVVFGFFLLSQCLG